VADSILVYPVCILNHNAHDDQCFLCTCQFNSRAFRCIQNCIRFYRYYLLPYYSRVSHTKIFYRVWFLFLYKTRSGLPTSNFSRS